MNQAQKSLITTFKKTIWSRFTSAIKQYKLIEDGDKIAVCISGGKDSMLLALSMKELKQHGINNFDVVFLTMDPGYAPAIRQKVEDNAKQLGIDLVVFEANIFDYVASVKEGSPCYLCARMRRGNLYAHAKQLGCNKIALGHHMDDVLETTLLSLFYNGQFKTMMPKLHSENFEGLQLIRPLFKVRERDIIAWKEKNNLQFINCACRFTEMCELDASSAKTSKRKQMKQLLADLEQTNPLFIENLFTSLKNVNLDTVLGYEKDGQKHFFADEYPTSRQ
jgi:tRNA(Ile)-lysidine synthase TilS/MesJ